MPQEFPAIRLVALDLDGTLLNREGHVTPRTRAALQAAVDKGVYIVPATGRPLASLPPEVAQLPGIRYVITCNGAAVWDLGTDPVGAVYRPLFQRKRAPHQHPGLLAAQPDAGGDCPRSLCRLRELPRRPAHFLGRIRLHRCPQHSAGRCPGSKEGRHRSVPAQRWPLYHSAGRSRVDEPQRLCH